MVRMLRTSLAMLMSLTPLATLDATWMEATRMSTPPADSPSRAAGLWGLAA